MKIDEKRIDEATLALLHLVTFDHADGKKAWKSFDWDALNRLHEAGYLSDPANKYRSVWLTEEGANKSLELFEKLFSKRDPE
jgi:hypothetical protein